MKLKQFKQHIEKIVKAIEKSNEIAKVFGYDGIVNIWDELIDSNVDLLQYHFNDENDWISYWLWDMEQGNEYEAGRIMIEGKDIPLKTIEDLYNILDSK